MIRIFRFDLRLSLFVSLKSVIGVAFHVCLSDRSDFRDVEELFAAFQGLHVSLTVGTLFASLVEKVEILICRAVKTRAPVISVRSRVWAFLCKDGCFSSELLLLSHVKINVFVAGHNVIRANFLEINQVLNIRTLSTPDVKIGIGLIALLAARHCTERF